MCEGDAAVLGQSQPLVITAAARLKTRIEFAFRVDLLLRMNAACLAHSGKACFAGYSLDNVRQMFSPAKQKVCHKFFPLYF